MADTEDCRNAHQVDNLSHSGTANNLDYRESIFELYLQGKFSLATVAANIQYYPSMQPWANEFQEIVEYLKMTDPLKLEELKSMCLQYIKKRGSEGFYIDTNKLKIYQDVGLDINFDSLSQ